MAVDTLRRLLALHATPASAMDREVLPPRHWVVEPSFTCATLSRHLRRMVMAV